MKKRSQQLLLLLWREFKTERYFLTHVVLFLSLNFVLNVSLANNIYAISLKFSFALLLILFSVVLNV